LEAGDPVPARRGRHLLWPAIALGHNRQLCFIAEPATTARVDHIQAADRLTIPDNVHGYNTVHIDVDIASALPNASIPQGGPARMRTPIPAVHGVVRWRLADLIQWLWDEHRLPISKQTLSREVRALGYRKLSARPRHHAKSDAAVAAFKKTYPRVWRKSRPTRLTASR
jgi:hypothetical protein